MTNVFDINEKLVNIFKNMGYLFLSQGVSYLAPVFVLSLLLKRLGVVGFGQYAIIMAYVAFLQVIIDYGFIFSATRKVSQHIDDEEMVVKTFISTIFIKIIIAILVFPVFILIMYFVCNDNDVLFYGALCSCSIVLGNGLFPAWFYQGIQKLKTVAISNAMVRVASCAFIYFTVFSEKDLWLVMLCQGVPMLLLSMIIIVVFFKRHKFYSVRGSDLINTICEGWHFFCASLWSTILANSGLLLLNSFGTPTVVGVYAAAERVVKTSLSIFTPITQSLYPYNCEQFAQSKKNGIQALRLTIYILLVTAGSVSLIMSLGAKSLVEFLKYPNAAVLIIIMLSVWSFLSVSNNILGVQALSAAGHGKEYSRIFFIASTITLLLMLFFLLVNPSGESIAISLILGELVLCVMLSYCFYNKFTIGVL